MAEKPNVAEHRKLFLESLEELAEIGGVSNNVSLSLRGEKATRAGELASMVHAQMCAHARWEP